jgi:hypothetical protein
MPRGKIVTKPELEIDLKTVCLDLFGQKNDHTARMLRMTPAHAAAITG